MKKTIHLEYDLPDSAYNKIKEFLDASPVFTYQLVTDCSTWVEGSQSPENINLLQKINSIIAGIAVVIDGKLVDPDAAVNLMDDSLRERLHQEMAPCTDQEFIEAYCRAHKKEFNETFQVN